MWWWILVALVTGGWSQATFNQIPISEQLGIFTHVSQVIRNGRTEPGVEFLDSSVGWVETPQKDEVKEVEASAKTVLYKVEQENKKEEADMKSNLEKLNNLPKENMNLLPENLQSFYGEVTEQNSLNAFDVSQIDGQLLSLDEIPKKLMPNQQLFDESIGQEKKTLQNVDVTEEEPASKQVLEGSIPVPPLGALLLCSFFATQQYVPSFCGGGGERGRADENRRPGMDNACDYFVTRGYLPWFCKNSEGRASVAPMGRTNAEMNMESVLQKFLRGGGLFPIIPKKFVTRLNDTEGGETQEKYHYSPDLGPDLVEDNSELRQKRPNLTSSQVLGGALAAGAGLALLGNYFNKPQQGVGPLQNNIYSQQNHPNRPGNNKYFNIPPYGQNNIKRPTTFVNNPYPPFYSQSNVYQQPKLEPSYFNQNPYYGYPTPNRYNSQNYIGNQQMPYRYHSPNNFYMSQSQRPNMHSTPGSQYLAQQGKQNMYNVPQNQNMFQQQKSNMYNAPNQKYLGRTIENSTINTSVENISKPAVEISKEHTGEKQVDMSSSQLVALHDNEISNELVQRPLTSYGYSLLPQPFSSYNLFHPPQHSPAYSHFHPPQSHLSIPQYSPYPLQYFSHSPYINFPSQSIQPQPIYQGSHTVSVQPLALSHTVSVKPLPSPMKRKGTFGVASFGANYVSAPLSESLPKGCNLKSYFHHGRKYLFCEKNSVTKGITSFGLKLLGRSKGEEEKTFRNKKETEDGGDLEMENLPEETQLMANLEKQNIIPQERKFGTAVGGLAGLAGGLYLANKFTNRGPGYNNRLSYGNRYYPRKPSYGYGSNRRLYSGSIRRPYRGRTNLFVEDLRRDNIGAFDVSQIDGQLFSLDELSIGNKTNLESHDEGITKSKQKIGSIVAGVAGLAAGAYLANKNNRPDYNYRPAYGNRPDYNNGPSYGNRPGYKYSPAYGNHPMYNYGPAYGYTPKRRPYGGRPGYPSYYQSRPNNYYGRMNQEDMMRTFAIANIIENQDQGQDLDLDNFTADDLGCIPEPIVFNMLGTPFYKCQGQNGKYVQKLNFNPTAYGWSVPFISNGLGIGVDAYIPPGSL